MRTSAAKYRYRSEIGLRAAPRARHAVLPGQFVETRLPGLAGGIAVLALRGGEPGLGFRRGAALSITGAAAVGVTGALAGAAFSWAWAKALVRRQVLQLTWPTSLEPFTLLSPRPQAAWPDSLKKCVTI